MSDAKAFLEKMPTAFDAEAAGDTNATIQCAISTPMHISVEDGNCRVNEGEADSPDVTLRMEDQDLVELLSGQLDGMTAFMTGKLQIDGDIMLAQKLPSMFDPAKLS